MEVTLDFDRSHLGGRPHIPNGYNTSIYCIPRDVGDGWAAWVITQQGFRRLVNPISTRRG